MAKTRYDPSHDRRLLSNLLRELSTIIEAFCRHEPTVRGKFVTLRRRCGKTPCRCARGELHETAVLVDRSSSRRRIYSSTLELRARLRRPVSDYRTLRRMRVRLKKLHREVLSACDRLKEHRLREGARVVQALVE